MKKIIILLFLFLLCYTCYIVYNQTNNNKLYITSIGDNNSYDIYLKNNLNNIVYNTDFINKDNTIKDILNTIKYNIEIEKNNRNISIHQILKKTDILIISIGTNDIYYKLNDNTKEIYTYLNSIINNYEEILKEINKYKYKEVFVLGYQNKTNNYSDIFTYINYKLKHITTFYNYTYIDLNKIIGNRSNYDSNYNLTKEEIKEIDKLIVEKIKKY